jgi:hypothetical protein
MPFFHKTAGENLAVALGRASAGTAEAVPALVEALEAVTVKPLLPVQMTQAIVALTPVDLASGVTQFCLLKRYQDAYNLDVKTAAMRKAVIRALGEVGPEARAVVPRLRVELLSRDSYVRETTKDALEKIEPGSVQGKSRAGAATP